MKKNDELNKIIDDFILKHYKDLHLSELMHLMFLLEFADKFTVFLYIFRLEIEKGNFKIK